MEEENNEPTDTDINAIMAQFSIIRMRYCEDRKRLTESERVLVTQREQLRLSREAEERERRKAEAFQRTLKQQQDIIDNFLGVNEENVELTMEIKQLRMETAELLEKTKAEKESWLQREESLKLAHKKELDNLKLFSERKARDARGDLDMYRAEYDMKRREMDTKFHTLQKEKRAELDIAMQICEEKTQKMDEKISNMMYNHDQQTKANAAHMSMYQQKIVDLERKLMQAEIEARRNKAPPPAAPQYAGNVAQQQAYRYNNNSALPQTILKQTPVWRTTTREVRGGGGGRGGRSNIQPLEFVLDEDTPKKVVTSGGRGGPKKRKLYNPNNDDML